MSHHNRIQISIPTEKLMMLLASEHLCIADVTALDTSSHFLLRQAALEICGQKLKGAAKQCQSCSSRASCQQAAQVYEQDVRFVAGQHRLSLQ